MELYKVSDAISLAIEILNKLADVKIVSDMYRLKPDEYAKGGVLVVNIIVNDKIKAIFENKLAEDIIFNPMGELIALEFLNKIISSSFVNEINLN